MEAALSTRLALDFFVKDDPITYVEIVAVDKDGKTVKIASPELVRFLSGLFLVEDDQ